MQDEEVGQNIDHIDRLELAGDTDCQAFMSELVEHVEYPIPASIEPCRLSAKNTRARLGISARMRADTLQSD
jgi:hypothetical protein